MFVNIPENFGSLWDDLVYEFVITQPEDLLFEVWDDNSGRLIGVKKFYSSAYAKFNIASILRYEVLPNMAIYKSGFFVANDGYVAVTVKCGDDVTPVRLFTLRREESKRSSLMSSMPLKRYVEYGDSDVLRLAMEEAFMPSAKVKVTYSGGKEESIVFRSEQSGQVHCFVVNTSQLEENPRSMKVEVDLDDESSVNLDYRFMVASDSSVRLAWISSAGGVEHFTFPRVSQQVIRGDGEMELTLRATLGSAEELMALSEILTSIKVWRVTKEGYSLVEVVSDELPLRCDGVLQVAEFKIREKSGGNFN